VLKVLEYFLEPLKEGYTLEKTLILALIFVFSAFLVYKFLKKIRVKIDRYFSFSIFFFILFGSSIRVLVDLEYFFSIIFVTPNIWIFVSLLTIFSLLLSKFFEKKFKIKYYKIFSAIGISISLPFLFLVLLNFKNYLGLFLTILFSIPALVIFKVLKLNSSNSVTIFSQYFDGIVAYISIKFFSDKLIEQHLFANIIFSIFPELFPVVKFLIPFFIVYFLDKEKGFDNFQKNFIKMVIAIHGFSISIRSFLLLLSV